MAENQSTAAPQKGTRATVESTNDAYLSYLGGQASLPRRPFGCCEDVQAFVEACFGNEPLTKVPDAMLVLLDERYELKAIETVPTLPMLPSDGTWANVYRHERVRYSKDLRNRALVRDAAAMVCVVKNSTASNIEDDEFIREDFKRFADDLFDMSRTVDVELLDVVTWRVMTETRDDEEPLKIESLYWHDWRAKGSTERRSPDDIVIRRDGTLVRR